MAIDPTRDPHARIVVKPLPSQVAAAKAKARAAGAGAASAGVPGASAAAGAAGQARPAAGAAGLAPDPFLRAANEDDDGYDPYSDRPAPREPLFQEDPWA
ncbi:hypothetical protein AALA69_03635 [Eggerthellaceae bacterium 24-137]